MIRTPTRREVLRLAGLSAGGLALGCGDNTRVRPPDDRHGVVVLEPSASALLISITAIGARSAVVEIAGPGEMPRIETLDVIDGRATLDVPGLAPATAYDITVFTDDGARLAHRARTGPDAADPRPVRIAVIADVDPAPDWASDIVPALIATDPDLLVSLGDVPYTDDGPPATTLAEYRARHLALRTHPELRTLFEAMAVRAIYDDHEFRNDWDNAFVAAEPARYRAATQAWDEMFPVRDAAPQVRYRAWRWGAHVECFLLDCRRFRSANAAPDDAHKTMLGVTQRAWLLDAVTRSTATFKLVFTSVPLDFGIGIDHWAGFTTERQLIFDALVGTRGVLFLSADQHYFAAHRHAYGIREFQVGPLRRGVGRPGPEAPGVLFRELRYNFGLVDVDGDRLTMRGVGADGTVFYEEALASRELTPRNL